MDIREAIAEVNRCNRLHVENITTWEIERARLRTQVRNANRNISVNYNNLYAIRWDPIFYATEIP